TSKAVYPTESVKLYSAIRAAQDSITGGWNKIDSEIDALVDEKKQREEDGYFSNEVIDVRAEFMRIFENKISVKEDEVGKDRFFVSISRDVKNETKVKEGDKVVYKPSDKVEDFINLLKGQKIDVVVTKNGGTEDFAIDAESFISADHSKDELLKKVGEDETGLSDALDTFDKNVEKYADAIIDTVFPYSMGEVKPKNRCSVYGLLTKPNEMGGWDFIHPVAARYVLYRLVAKLEKAIKGIALKDSREEAVAGGDIGTKFDNPKTSKTEKTPVELLNSSKGLFQSESSFFDDFERRYADFITAKIELCEKYEKEALQISVFRKLIERLNNLINKLESFFGGIGEVQEKLQSELNDNIAETNGVVGKTVYVYGSKQDKEAVYQSLNLEVDRSNSKINKSVIDSIYGGICAEKRASNPENQEYVGISVINSFVLETVKSFMEKIDEDENNKEKVYLDIYTALCKESDVAVKSQDDKSKKSSGLDSLNLKTGTIKADHSEANRHKTALNTLNNKLKRMAAPFLIHNKKLPDNSLGIVTTRFKTFWGFSPDVAAAYPAIGAELGVNADLQADSAYPKNELYCYRAVYGLEASYIPKFNELSGGLYYTCYDEIVGGMVEDAAGRQGERAFVRTPHLDMRWHNILPYVSDEKQKSTELGFFHGFWLAVAYGILKLDKEGNFCIRRSVDGGYGMYFEDDIALKRKDKNIYKTDVLNLIEVLKADKVFTGTDIPALEQRFKAEMEELITYEGTEVLKGLTTKVEDLNPICIVSRYNETIGHKKLYSAVLVKALEDIAGEMAASYKVERSEKQCEEAKYGICKRIYDSSARYRGKADVFGNWETAFEKYKLKETSSPDDSSM
ncbi:MAG: hypothetical protein IJE40_03070, partial [Clostridia bacterium]|nr:hypothetical protein [Clostridia bacterium]